jgi:hypothetical protein
MARDISQEIVAVVRGWATARDRIVRVSKGEEAAAFSKSHSMHTDFLRELSSHGMALAGALPVMTAAEWEAFRELVSSHASVIQAAQHKGTAR